MHVNAANTVDKRGAAEIMSDLKSMLDGVQDEPLLGLMRVRSFVTQRSGCAQICSNTLYLLIGALRRVMYNISYSCFQLFCTGLHSRVSILLFGSIITTLLLFS